MKYNNFLLALALCAAIQSNVSFGSEETQIQELKLQEPQSQSYWQRYAPQRIQDLSSYISQKATNAYDVVSKWSTKKKIIVASAIIGSLAAVYNKDQIMQWISNTLNQEANSISISSIYPDSWDNFEQRKAKYIKKLELPVVYFNRFVGLQSWNPSQLRVQFEKNFPGVLKDPAYLAAIENLEAQGAFSY